MLKLLKTSLRSTMGNERLNGLACSLSLVEEFSRRHPRRLLLINPFSE